MITRNETPGSWPKLSVKRTTLVRGLNHQTKVPLLKRPMTIDEYQPFRWAWCSMREVVATVSAKKASVY